jgi:chorismate-pyruvate lyase
VIRHLFGGPVTIQRLPCPPASLPHEATAFWHQHNHAISHRRVHLLANGRPVSEADLWFRPHMLWPGMAETLATTDTPFGLVVRPMGLKRRTLAAALRPAPDPVALIHRAELCTQGGDPVAMVAERYLASACATLG